MRIAVIDRRPSVRAGSYSNWNKAGLYKQGLRARGMVAPVRWPTPVPFTLTARSRIAVHSRQSGSIGCKAGVRKAPIAALSEREHGEENHGGKEPEHSC